MCISHGIKDAIRRTYDHYNYVRAAMEKWAAELMRIVSGRRGCGAAAAQCEDG
jgi:hypothetical protein